MCFVGLVGQIETRLLDSRLWGDDGADRGLRLKSTIARGLIALRNRIQPNRIHAYVKVTRSHHGRPVPSFKGLAGHFCVAAATGSPTNRHRQRSATTSRRVSREQSRLGVGLKQA